MSPSDGAKKRRMALSRISTAVSEKKASRDFPLRDKKSFLEAATWCISPISIDMIESKMDQQEFCIRVAMSPKSLVEPLLPYH